MRVDDDTLYYLPPLDTCYHHGSQKDQMTPWQSRPLDHLIDNGVTDSVVTELDEEKWDPEGMVVSASAVVTINSTNHPGICLDLVPLPLLTEDGEQTPIGARGWYASAVLSAMLLCGHETLQNDLLGPMAMTTTKRTDDADDEDAAATKTISTVVELGSGALGLAGMTMAWILAQYRYQQQQKQKHEQVRDRLGATSDGINICNNRTAKCQVVMTDYDPDCLEQLERNAMSARQTLKEYFPPGTSDTYLPDVVVEHLDWNEYDQNQAPLLDGDNTGLTGAATNSNSIHFVCGAALVYTEETAACADQVAKILKQNPQAVVWVVQWPRNGWFQVFQMQLERKHKCNVTKYSPRDIHPNIHGIAQTLMPPQLCLKVEDIKAVRITSATKVEL